MVDNIWSAMTKYQFKCNAAPSFLHCKICHNLSVDPVCSPCGCIFCKSCIDRYLGSETKLCPGQSADCCLLSYQSDIINDYRARKEILSLLVNCPHSLCTMQCKLDKMIDHLRMCDKSPVDCVFAEIGCGESGLIPKSLEKHLETESVGHMKMLIDHIRNLENRINQLHVDLGNERKERIQDREQISKLESQLENDEQRRLSDIETIKSQQNFLLGKVSTFDAISPKHGEISFIIDNFRQKRKLAKSDPFMAAISGAPFYIYEYKMYLDIFPTGQLNKSDFVSVFFTIQKGVYDNGLKWPMPFVVNIGLVNQETGKCDIVHRVSAATSNKTSAYERPKITDDSCSDGIYNFIRYRDLKDSSNFLKNDCVIFQVSLTKS